jgi:hypothetical protein
VKSRRARGADGPARFTARHRRRLVSKGVGRRKMAQLDRSGSGATTLSPSVVPRNDRNPRLPWGFSQIAPRRTRCGGWRRTLRRSGTGPVRVRRRI